MELGKRVVVIGGGNVAVDVARTVRRIGDERELRKFGAVSETREQIEAALDMARSALRMGAREVTMVCLESRITSYNVCYTKLLRHEGRGEGIGSRTLGELRHHAGDGRIDPCGKPFRGGIAVHRGRPVSGCGRGRGMKSRILVVSYNFV